MEVGLHLPGGKGCRWPMVEDIKYEHLKNLEFVFVFHAFDYLRYKEVFDKIKASGCILTLHHHHNDTHLNTGELTIQTDESGWLIERIDIRPEHWKSVVSLIDVLLALKKLSEVELAFNPFGLDQDNV